MAAGTTLSHVYPLGAHLGTDGRLQIGGCDVLELAAEFGTPVYVFDEDDLRARARTFLQAAADSGHPDMHVVFASKACPCTAVLRLFAAEGLWCDAASEGELHLALQAGFDPERIIVHGNAKSRAELQMALRERVGLIALDNFDEIARLQDILVGGPPPLCSEPGGGPPALRSEPQPVLIRVTPDVRGETHEMISTGQADSKFGFAMSEVPSAIERVAAVPGLRFDGLHAHIGSQLLELEPFRREIAELARLGDHPVLDLGGGLGVAYTASQDPPAVERYVQELVQATLPGHGRRRLLIEPGRSLVANACVTLYTVQSVKRNLSTWVAVDGGMSDNLRPMLYGSVYEAEVADRFGGSDPCVLTGKHCESGDVIVRGALLEDPRVGDVIVTPATGAYGFAMANNYNGVPRPPVIFCRDGRARLVVRRERLDELSARDVL